MSRAPYKGFSLIEVMAVVGIIIVIALIAVPSYQRFTSKAKQANAKAELSSIYAMEIAFNQEHGSFHNNLHYIGYTPAGYPTSGTPTCPTASASPGPTRHYRVGFSGTDLDAVSRIPTIPCPGIQSYAATTNSPAITTSAINASISFTAVANGVIRSNASAIDIWTIDQLKNLINTQVGY